MGEKTKPLLNDAAVLRRKEFSKNWCVFQLNLQFKTLFCNRTHCQNACSLEKIETRRTLYSPWSFSMKSEVELYPVQQSKTVLLNAAICFSWALRKWNAQRGQHLNLKKRSLHYLLFQQSLILIGQCPISLHAVKAHMNNDWVNKLTKRLLKTMFTSFISE